MGEFDKVKAFDELMIIIKAENENVSSIVSAMQRGQNFIKKIYDDAFSAGFEKGIEVSKKIDDI